MLKRVMSSNHYLARRLFFCLYWFLCRMGFFCLEQGAADSPCMPARICPYNDEPQRGITQPLWDSWVISFKNFWLLFCSPLLCLSLQLIARRCWRIAISAAHRESIKVLPKLTVCSCTAALMLYWSSTGCQVPNYAHSRQIIDTGSGLQYTRQQKGVEGRVKPKH